MNFPTILRAECVNVATPPDTRCQDSAFAIANPGLCPPTASLIIKPAVALACALGSVQFKAFTVTAGVETDVTTSTVFLSSDANTAVVGAVSGNATGLSAGEATISASYQGMTATAALTVLGGNCCDDQHVAMLVLVDTSRSMSQVFNGDYPTRLDFAKAAATRFISEVNPAKDTVGLISFNLAGNVPLAALSSNIASVGALVPAIAQTQQKTGYYAVLAEAISELAASGADRKVILIISDGEDTSGTYTDATNPISLLSEFKNQGGIVMCLGVRASANGFPLLSVFSTGGFFINAYDGVESVALGYLSGIKGYVCAGRCTPEGDINVHQGALNYANFINWDVVAGHVDLLGENLMDLLPGNGLYVDLAGSLAAFKGVMQSKAAYSLTSGHTYRLTAELAGNQRVDKTPESARLKVFTLAGQTILDQTVLIFDFKQGFTPFAFNFTAPADMDVYLSVEQLETPAGEDAIGLLLNRVKFEDTTDLTTLLDDDFDNENMVYLPPRCGVGTTWTWLTDLNSYGYATGSDCYSYGAPCLDSPPGPQLPDPHALPNIESGYTPPKQFNSTQQACASCDPGFVNLAATALTPVSVTVAQCDESIVAALDGALWMMPIIQWQDQYSGTCQKQTTVVQLLGDPNVTYQVALRFRGVVERKRMNGTPLTGDFLAIENPSTIPYTDVGGNEYSLITSQPPKRYLLNGIDPSGSAGVGVYVVDFTITIPIAGNSAVTLLADPTDDLGPSFPGLGFENTNYQQLVVPGITDPEQPYVGQFLKMDVVSVT